ncbi:MAG TPA: GDL motif peptide-associated radical SAM/SPASM maturase [Thermoanaerobaculia bacterium]|nr:GDL motif peptide-associated radical SAM/SPASM maturase [Thermoanaerobaculia bacterium]
MSAPPPRALSADDLLHPHPVHVVWEITLACNLKCAHCGSRAGKVRPDELSTTECFEVVDQLARLGTREITLIGGEAYLRRDWTDIIARITSHGMLASMQTGGRALTAERVRAAKAAGLGTCGVSVDGLEELHDEIRGVKGSFRSAMQALELLREHGIPSGCNTQIGSRTMPQLRGILHEIAARGARGWQIQLTVAMGNAVDNDHLLLQPYELGELMPLLGEIYDEARSLGVGMQAGNNIGYFGPYEHKWRLGNGEKHFSGCAAGQAVLGIEADGAIKGCPSLPTAQFTGGNVRDMTIEDIWTYSREIRFSRDRQVHELWGRCRDCYYAEVCRGGCTWTSTVLFGRPGNNPYCHYRVDTLAKQGLRERIVKTEEAPGTPFDQGRFALITEPLDGGDGPRTIAEPPVWEMKEPQLDRPGRVPPTLEVCYGCKQYVYAGTTTCPHCGGDVPAFAREQRELEQAIADIRAFLGQHAASEDQALRTTNGP